MLFLLAYLSIVSHGTVHTSKVTVSSTNNEASGDIECRDRKDDVGDVDACSRDKKRNLQPATARTFSAKYNWIQLDRIGMEDMIADAKHNQKKRCLCKHDFWWLYFLLHHRPN